MDLEKKLIETLNQSQHISNEQLHEVRTASHDTAVSAILACLDYPNLNALIAAYNVPDARYEEKLLSYSPEDMHDELHAEYWMLTLGRMQSKKAFDKIQHYVKNTNLSHMAFMSLAKIDLARTIALFEGFLDEHCNMYDKNNVTYAHDSGFNTLLALFERYPAAKKLVKKYDFSKNEQKKQLVQDALRYKVLGS